MNSTSPSSSVAAVRCGFIVTVRFKRVWVATQWSECRFPPAVRSSALHNQFRRGSLKRAYGSSATAGPPPDRQRCLQLVRSMPVMSVPLARVHLADLLGRWRRELSHQRNVSPTSAGRYRGRVSRAPSGAWTDVIKRTSGPACGSPACVEPPKWLNVKCRWRGGSA